MRNVYPFRRRRHFWRGAFSHRVLPARLAVQVQPSIRGMLIVKITSASSEPLYRQFFTRLGQLCGRPVGALLVLD